MSKREWGTVRSVRVGLEDHGIWTVMIHLEFASGYQGFGGLALDDDRLRKLYIQELCTLFDVSDLKLIEGQECFVLRCFGTNNDPIEGLEVDSRRFTHTGWRRQHIDPTTPSVLDCEIKRRRESADAYARRVHDERAMMYRLPDLYTDWEPSK